MIDILMHIILAGLLSITVCDEMPDFQAANSSDQSGIDCLLDIHSQQVSDLEPEDDDDTMPLSESLNASSYGYASILRNFTSDESVMQIGLPPPELLQ